ncbi:MAG: flavodoxin domain-containing protein, partial [Anaerolineae bacterium]|nr:flavodoxin domain-containing protein [Anaerolineae bacterium]
MTFRIEDQDPRYLIVYESTHEHDINRLQDLFNCWVARFERGERFGVIYVSESFDDHHEHDERDVAYEEAFTQLLNDFRRDYKSQSERWTVGFVRVFPAEWLAKQRKEKPDYLTDAQADADRTARYIWGVPGSVFDTFEAARAWLDEQFEASAPTAPSKEKGKGLQRVGLFYGSTTGMTEYVAEQIQAAWSAAGLEPIAIQNIGLVKNVSTLLNYDYLIFGIPTWNVGQLQDDWAIAFPQLNTLDFTGKQAALFGVGDQYGYPYN